CCRRERAGDDQARRHGARRHPGGDCRQAQAAGLFHRRRRAGRRPRTLFRRRFRQGDCWSELMGQPVFERDPSDPKKREINPLLKLALELGPLMVFLFANARAEALVETWAVLGSLGGPIFLATGLFMVATAIALAISWLLTRTLPIMPLIS